MLVHLNIGSNQGDRHALLERAVAFIADSLHPVSCRVSHPVESSPWGFSSPFPFLNIGIDLELSEMPPEALLDALQAIERSMSSMPHRNPDGTYRDREIDIDIILIDRLQICTPRLQVPHPRMSQRDFVMKPLQELRPDFRPPCEDKP